MINIFNVDDLLVFFLVFSRLTGSVITMPIFSEKLVETKVKLCISLFLSLIITSIVKDKIPTITGDSLYLFLFISEFIYGVFIGLIAKLFFDSLSVAGTIISAGSGLSSVLLFDPSFNSQSTVETKFLTHIVTTLFLVSNLHFIFIDAFVKSYDFFIPAEYIFHNDLSAAFVRLISASFLTGVKIAIPNMVAALISSIIMAILARLMPQIQIFMINLPVQILTSFIILGIIIIPCLDWYMNNYADFLNNLFS